MNSATIMPATPSIGKSVYCPPISAASTTVVATTSESESVAVAAIEAEFIRFAILRLNQNSHTFTSMAAISTPIAAYENSVGEGVMIFSIEDHASSKPMNIISTETISPATYSILPWPKGCSLSGFCPASLKPISVITEEAASEKLFIASAIIATDPAIMPTVSLPATSSMLSIMPVMPESCPQRVRTLGSSASPLGTNSRKSSSLMISSPPFCPLILSYARQKVKRSMKKFCAQKRLSFSPGYDIL